MKKGLTIFLGIILLMVIVAVAGILGFNKQFNALMEEIDKEYAAISTVDLNKIADGEYHCKFGKIPVVVDLNVCIKDHKITAITMLEQSSGPGYEALETIDRILEKQSPNVDIVTGATFSSKSIMIAVNKALNGSGS